MTNYFPWLTIVAVLPIFGGSLIFFLPHKGKKDYKWIDFFDFYWRLGIDGLSIGPILLTGFITTLATLAAWPITRDSQLFHFLMLAMYSGQIGLFSSQDLLLFFIMWELELIPVYLLISMWG
ncbi:hypothetical protein RGQ29_020753 [Quercus rubra]|uniref:NADH dehydrogenase subunit 4 n=1 Tax=Quercus rubra TaxID=3512 RepID=A0AAN7FD40_QUERU|nr:hypothetical protein RGQ29_020753 [Quercus rubra]